MAHVPPFTTEETGGITSQLQRQREQLPDIPPSPPPPETLTNRELQQAILDAHALLLKTGAAHLFQKTLENHFVQLLAVQRHRVGLTDEEPK